MESLCGHTTILSIVLSQRAPRGRVSLDGSLKSHEEAWKSTGHTEGEVADETRFATLYESNDIGLAVQALTQ